MFFDPAYYRREYPDSAAREPLLDFLDAGADAERKPCPIFDPAYYLKRNPDVAESGMNPLVHYLRHGCHEGRRTCCDDTSLTWMENVPLLRADFPGLDYLHNRQRNLAAAKPLLVAAYASSQGNFFFSEIRDLLADGLRAVGIEVQAADETRAPPAGTTHHLVVAPHEFFTLGDGRDWLGRRPPGKLIAVNAEQPQTSWFATALPFLQKSDAIADINPHCVALLNELGLHAAFLPLGFLEDYAPSRSGMPLPDSPLLGALSAAERHYDSSTESSWSERPIDLCFIGYLSRRREIFFAREAAALQDLRTFLFLPTLRGPFISGTSLALTTDMAMGLTQRSKILLNIHQGSYPYFEWHRIVLRGFWQKTVVLTERCLEVPGFRAEEHYLQRPLEELIPTARWLVSTPEGRAKAEEVRENAWRTLKSQYDLKTIISAFVTHYF